MSTFEGLIQSSGYNLQEPEWKKNVSFFQYKKSLFEPFFNEWIINEIDSIAKR